MAAFDVTTTPPTQNVAPGSAAKIRVVVSNRLGKPVMGRVDGALVPASATAWLAPLAEPQRRFEADPAATLTFDFTINVPANAAPAALQFRATVIDVLASDDNKAEGEVVGLNVTAAAKPVEDGKKGGGVPWWVWVIVGVVLIGAGFGIYKLVSRGVPSVIGKTAAKATKILTDAGFATPTVKDTIDAGAKDTTVVNQVPEAGSDLPPDSLKGKAPATIVVNRRGTTVPAIVGQPLALAIERLREAGLRVGANSGLYTAQVAQDDQIASVNPVAGTPVPSGSSVDIVIYAFSDRPPVVCPDPRRCFVRSKAEWESKILRLARPER